MGADVARRQWGAEKITETLPTVHPIPSGMKMALGRLAIVATVWLIRTGHEGARITWGPVTPQLFPEG